MLKTITWTTNHYTDSHQPHETDGLFYAQDLFRYRKLQSPLSIKFCLRGNLNYVSGSQRFSIPAGGFYLANKGAELECLPNEPGYQALILFFTGELMHDVHRAFHLGERQLLDVPYTDVEPVHFFEHTYCSPTPLTARLGAVARQMQVENESSYALAPDIFYELAEQLLSFQQNTAGRIERIGSQTPAVRRELYRRVLAAREFLYSHWEANPSLQEVARQACLSPYHFHRTFKAAFGCSPMRWFRRRKLGKARELLQSGQFSISEVALGCGYADLATFSKAFKREWGVSPSGAGSISSLLRG
ncbi:MAG: helix-turn-helix transcriptional regulator [Lewinellaceae bacterium]|nr:helix-turn-helix transcriptional regulator [Phaeodactylibacter sp.]MCB9036244.1 helix-turn-helix transcriptional regulator [Lewinellaceae bacterium]